MNKFAKTPKPSYYAVIFTTWYQAFATRIGKSNAIIFTKNNYEHN